MKFFTNKNVIHKVVIALLIVILFGFCIPKITYAENAENPTDTAETADTNDSDDSGGGRYSRNGD